MSESLYSEKLNLDLTPENTSLFNFLGESAIGPHCVFNHIFIQKEDDEGEVEFYAYVFADHDDYDDIVRHIRKHRFPQHLNLPEVAEMDQIAFEATHGEITPTFPEEWLDGKT